MTLPGVRLSDDFELIERDVKFGGRVVTVAVERLKLPNGVEVEHEILSLPPSVAVVPLLRGETGSLEVVLVEQFRSSVRGFMHEVPAGIVESGEDPAVCAARELEEETGFVPGRVTHLARLFPIPGPSAHAMDYFLAEDLAPGTQALEEAECLSVKRFPLSDLLEAVLAGGMGHGVDPGRPRASGAAPGGDPVVIDCKTHLGLLHVAFLLNRRGAEGRESAP